MSQAKTLSRIAQSERLYLDPLSVEEHLEDFHALWTDADAVKYSTRVVQTSLEESAAWLPTILNSPDQPDVDKYAIMLRDFDDSDSESNSQTTPTQILSALPTRPTHPISPTQTKHDQIPKTTELTTTTTTSHPQTPISPPSTPLTRKPKCIGIVGTNRYSDQGMETGYCIHKTYWGKGYATEAFSLFLSYFWTLEERNHIPHLVAKIHAENRQSFRVVEKCGGRVGERIYISKHAGRNAKPSAARPASPRDGDEASGVDWKRERERESDDREVLHCYYFHRPGSSLVQIVS